MERTDKQKPIKIGTAFKCNGVVHTIVGFVNCTPGCNNCFWDYTLAYKQGKLEKEVHMDSNMLSRYYLDYAGKI